MRLPWGQRWLSGGPGVTQNPVDATGKLFGTETFAATGTGYVLLPKWFLQHGRIDRVGIEGTGV